MSKTWKAECISFKGKHPHGEVKHEVIVKAKYKKDAIEAAEKELKFWDPENHEHYKKPAVTEFEDEAEAANEHAIYLMTKEKCGQMEIAEHESKELNAEMTVRAILKNIEEECFSDEMIEEAAEKLEDVLAEHENLDVQATLENLAQHDWKITFPMDTESEVRKMLLNIRRLRHDVISLLIKHQESASNEVKKAETELPPVAETEAEEEFIEPLEELTATIATVAEYPLIEPYAVRLSIAKNGESFVHSMTLINTTNGASLVGQPDIFNPKPFSNIENAVVYGLAMAIDAVNKYLVDFVEPSRVEKCVDILSGYAQDAEGNFMERYTGDHHLTNASFMAVSKPKETPPAEKELTNDVKRIMSAVVTHQSFTRAFHGTAVEIMASMVERNFVALHDKYGMLPAAQIVEHIIGMTDAGKLQTLEECEEIVSHYVNRVYADDQQESADQEEITVQYYAGQQWRHYIKEIMAQFEPPMLDEKEIDLAAQNVAHVFNDWKIALFAEKDSYTTNAEIFKDECYLNLASSDGALEFLKSYSRTQDALCDVLADAFDDVSEFELSDKAREELSNLIQRLLVDESLKCPYDSATIKALIYSDLQKANPIDESTITNPTLKMQWWHNLSADFAKQQAARMQQNTPISEQNAEIAQPNAPISEQSAPENEITAHNATDFEMKISPLDVSYHGDAPKNEISPIEQALNAKVEEVSELAEAFEKKVCVHGDGAGVEYKPRDERFTVNTTEKVLPEGVLKTEPEEIAEPEITPDPTPAQEFYGDKLLSGEIDAPYQLAIALMLKKHSAENYFNESEYQLAACYLEEAVAELKKELPALEPGLTVESMVKNRAWNPDTIEESLLDKELLKNAAYAHAVFDYDDETFDFDRKQEVKFNEPEITPDPIPAQEFYGDKLLSGEIDAPYQLAIALMLKKHGAENYYNEIQYQEKSAALQSVVMQLKQDMPALEPGLTVENFVENNDLSTPEMIDECLTILHGTDWLYQELYEHAVFEEQTPPAEAPEYEPETTRQDNEPLNDEPIASVDHDVPVNDYVEPAQQEFTVREMFKRMMKAANENIGLVGADWGYTINKQWTEERNTQRSDAHVEIGIWIRDKNGNKGEPVSFYGVSNANIGNYINDAMMLAVVNGLEMILFSLGIEVEG